MRDIHTLGIPTADIYIEKQASTYFCNITITWAFYMSANVQQLRCLKHI